MIKIFKLPEEYQFGFLFNIAKGKQLDVWARDLNLKRKRLLYIFKEPDFLYKNRIAKKAFEEYTKK